MNQQQKRKVYLVDNFLQLGIAFRVVVYCLAAFMFVLLTLTFWQTFVTDGGLFAEHLINSCRRHAPVLVGMFLFLPFAIYDSIKLSHKFAGPIQRLRTDLENFHDDKSIRVHFRDHDYLQDLPDTVNELLDYIQNLESQITSQKQEENVLAETLSK